MPPARMSWSAAATSMFESLPYRTALVTGATAGIGRAIVIELRRMGLEVFAVGRNERSLRELVEEAGVMPIEGDVRDVASIVARLVDRDIDILVNNAGILSTRAAFQQIDPAEIDVMIDVNFKAPMHLTRALLPGMVERRRGHLIFMGSSGGRAPFPGMGVYGPAKAGLSLFCDNLRLDLLGTGVRVTEIVPGRVQTGLYRDALGLDQAQTLLYEGYRSIQPEHIARLVGQAVALPVFVDVTRIEVFPTDQATGGGTMVRFE